MGYTRAQVRTALAKARDEGRSTSGMAPELRDTELQLERWGLLPLPGDDTVDKRIADWYAAQGLAVRAETEAPRGKPEKAEPAVIMSAAPHDAALLAAEAALAAAQAALAYARSMTPPAA
jgi:multidrug efflux pump subunit AcrA (membrane-fusion protein)